MLPIQFSSHDIEITDIFRDFINKKFEHLKKHAHKITSIHIFFNVSKMMHAAEATVHVPGLEISAKAESEDMYKTIDLLVDKLVKQLEKHKEKLSKRH